ncbi:MAG TPA: sulfatase [Bacteroidales bacterium]|nr:sulfatase [Bacteroidales bacterium]
MKNKIFISVIFISAILAGACTDSGKNVNIQKPNILIALANGISYPHMSAYGTKWVQTPGFDRVAEEGILFRNAYTSNSISSPSRASFLTGRNSWQLEDAANNEPYFPVNYTGFIEALDNNGYYTGYTARGWYPGIALDSSGAERHLTGKPFNSRTTVPPSTGISDIDYTGNFIDFLDSREKDKPFCFWYGADEPGRRYEFGSGVKQGKRSVSDIDRVPGFWPDNEVVRTDMLDYAFEIQYFDSHLAKMLQILEERGELENTIVIVTADNGMPFPRAKGQAYEYSNHIPLSIMWGRGIRNKGREVLDFISLTDIVPTILEATGIDVSKTGMQKFQGRSFMNIFSSAKKGWIDDTRKFVLTGRERNNPGRPGDAGYPVRGIIMDGFLFITNYFPQRWPSGNPETGYPDVESSPTKSSILDLQRSGSNHDYWRMSFDRRPEEELYLLSEDPECIKNLANDPGYNPVKRRLNEELYLELLQQDDPRVYDKGDVFDKYPYGRENLRDFFGKLRRGELTAKDAEWLDPSDFESY